MLIRRIAPIALLASAAISLHAGTTAPATMPVGDYSDPKKAVASFLAALEASDSRGIHAALVVAPENQAAIDAIIDLWIAQATLYTAAKDRFGDQAEAPFGSVNTQITTRMKALQDAPVKITGDSAIITLPADDTTQASAGTIVLKQITNNWKLDAATLFSLTSTPKDKTDQRIALAKKLIAVTNQTATDIASGKFPSANEAYQEFWNRSLAASKEIDQETTQPTSRPRP